MFFPTWVALVRHYQTLCGGPVDQVEVNVAQVQLRQAVKGSFHGPLPLILGAQFTAGAKRQRRIVKGCRLPLRDKQHLITPHGLKKKNYHVM